MLLLSFGKKAEKNSVWFIFYAMIPLLSYFLYQH